ncbi:glutaredoxin domain-containing protein [Amycolatopsis nigrescens]|uniref:glutaredoxin domain-containing protein n=1 Tax=Amycolatopsis nigrescens TaxID=381445 RepID=UPI0003A531A4|nr:glutaredoxin domain-containing protein [Amycolatopsis nigrescens]
MSTEQPATGQGITAIDVYWRPGCPFCMALARPLRRSGLPVREFNIWEDPEAAARVRSVADGNETVPTVFIGPHAMVNPSFGQLESAVREHAPELLDAAQPVRRGFWPFRRAR